MVNSPTRYALENLRVSSKFGDIQLTLIAKEDNQQAVNAKDRFAHFPSWRRSLDNLDDFAVVFRRRGRRSERYQQMMIRITARGRRRTRRTKHGSETHVSSPMCTHPNHGQPRLNGTRHFRSGSISTSSAAFTDVHSRRILLLLLLQRLLLPRSVRPLLPAIRPRCDRREQRLLSIPAGTGRDISRGGCGAAAVHRAVRSLAECGRGDKRVIAPPRSIRADTTPNGETVTSEREGAARLCQPARGGGRALAEGTTPIPALAVSRLRSNEEERGNRLFFPPRRTISREKSILEAVAIFWK